MSDDRRRLTVTDITNGWCVRVVCTDGSTFVAVEDNPGQRAFFVRHAGARALVKDLREHGLRGRIVKAQLILKTGA